MNIHDQVDAGLGKATVALHKRYRDAVHRFRIVEQTTRGITEVASLADIIRSKELANRPKDRATLPILYALQDEIARGAPK